MQDRQRTSIWSVREDWQRLYIFLFSLQFAAVVGFITWHEINFKTANSWPDSLIAVGETISGLTVAIAAESLVLTEIVMVLAQWYKERSERKAAEAAVRAAAENQQKWESWLQRQMEAAVVTSEFTEPPPSLERKP